MFYLWALNDLYGMKAKRLARAYGGAEAVSKAMARDSMQVFAKVKEIEDAGLRMRFCGKNAMDMAKRLQGYELESRGKEKASAVSA